MGATILENKELQPQELGNQNITIFTITRRNPLIRPQLRPLLKHHLKNPLQPHPQKSQVRK
jgi:hypothetical protein